MIDSKLEQRDLRVVLARAELHRGEWLKNWRRVRAGETPSKIEPLR